MKVLDGLWTGVLFGVQAILGATECRAQSCSPYWSSSTIAWPPVLGHYAVWDDGTGETPYVFTGPLYGNRVKKWDGAAWVNLPNTGLVGPNVINIGTNGGLATIDTAQGRRLMLYVTRFNTSGEAPSPPYWDNREDVPIVFNGSAWEPLVQHPSFRNVNQLRYVNLGDGYRYYGITRVSDSQGTGDHVIVRKWVDSSWQTIGAANDASGYAYLADADFGTGRALYLFGYVQPSGFTSINGMPAPGFAKWDGNQWTAPWPGRVVCNRETFALVQEPTGPALYGFFNAWVNGVMTDGLGRYDGTSFRGVGWVTSQGGGTVGISIRDLISFDDGTGSKLLACGAFYGLTTGVAANNIARFDGQNWAPVGDGSAGEIGHMAIMHRPQGQELYITMGSTYQGIGAGSSPTIPCYVSCPNCYANCDRSEASPKLNVNDFMCFLRAYAGRDPYANCTIDANINAADFICFMNKFAAGCP